LRAKDLLADLTKQIACLYPKTISVNSIDELIEVLQDDFTFPVIIKGKYHLSYLVYNLDAAIIRATEIIAQWGYPVLVQERIVGNEVNVVALADYNGGLRGSVAVKKQVTTALGKIWTAVTIHDDSLVKLCANFVAETKWRGPFELECMISKGKLYLIEINPRFPSWVYCATLVGVNLAAMLVELIETESCATNFTYPLGKVFMRYPAEFTTDLEHFHNLILHKSLSGDD
jgi:carbamoyl-phosphate synthase large subunit